MGSEALDVQTLLKRDLGEGIEIKSGNEIWYCPGNTCELFKASKAHKDFPAYIYLYLFHQSDYIYLNMPIGGNKAFREAAIEEPIVKSQ